MICVGLVSMWHESRRGYVVKLGNVGFDVESM